MGRVKDILSLIDLDESYVDKLSILLGDINKYKNFSQDQKVLDELKKFLSSNLDGIRLDIHYNKRKLRASYSPYFKIIDIYLPSDVNADQAYRYLLHELLHAIQEIYAVTRKDGSKREVDLINPKDNYTQYYLSDLELSPTAFMMAYYAVTSNVPLEFCYSTEPDLDGYTVVKYDTHKANLVLSSDDLKQRYIRFIKLAHKYYDQLKALDL